MYSPPRHRLTLSLHTSLHPVRNIWRAYQDTGPLVHSIFKERNQQFTTSLSSLANWIIERKNGSIERWMENNVRLFSDEILYHARDILANEFGHKNLKIGREFTVKGETHNGQVDLAVLYDDTIVLVVEAKASNLELGKAQNLLQLRAAYEQNKRNQVKLGNTMYGLVTTGTEWVFTKLIVRSKNTFTAAQSKPFTLPLKKATNSEMLLDGLNLLLGKIMWPINEKAKRLSRRC
jgi:hypothetical protein